MPSVRDTLNVTPSQIGIMLFIGALGSLVILPTAGPLIGAVGTKRAMRISASLWLLGMLGSSAAIVAHNLVAFSLSLIAVSAGMSLWGSVMNVEGGIVEVGRRKQLLPQLHALFSVGAVLGAALTALVTHCDVPVAAHMIALALPVWLILVLSAGLMLSDEEVATFSGQDDAQVDLATKRQQVRARTRQAWTERRTLMIAILVIASSMLEGSANDWLALAMVDAYAFRESQASLVFAMYMTGMVCVRLLAPRLYIRFGPQATVRTTLIISVGGLLLVGFAPHWGFALLGVVMWATGSALVYPASGSALSYDPVMTAARMTVMTSIAFAAYLGAPALLGVVADYTGYHRALLLVIPIVLLSAYLTKYLPIPRDDETRL